MQKYQQNNSDDEIKLKEKKKIKRMPVWKLVITDILLTVISLCIFAMFHHVLPQSSNDEQKTVATVEDNEKNEFALPGSYESSNNDEANNTDNTTNNDTRSISKRGDTKVDSNRGNTNTSDFSSDKTDIDNIDSQNKTTTEVNNYKSENINLTVNKVEIGEGSDKITYYVSDIYVKNVNYLKTAFATGTYGKNYRENILDMAEENDAVLAVSGDFYGNSEEGVVIRNGVLYRSVVNDADICVLFTEGTMKTYSPEEFDADEVILKGAWQAWTFGPELLDGSGNVLASFNTTSYLNKDNPRCALGYIEEGHYVFVVVDGRDEGYSKGATLSELAQIMADEGCMTAY
ncbi:MAG: phosphodiester glycosidase family protein, partial [Sedimentibacter sp.]